MQSTFHIRVPWVFISTYFLRQIRAVKLIIIVTSLAKESGGSVGYPFYRVWFQGVRILSRCGFCIFLVPYRFESLALYDTLLWHCERFFWPGDFLFFPHFPPPLPEIAIQSPLLIPNSHSRLRPGTLQRPNCSLSPPK